MIRVGIIGDIGSGKSFVSKLFKYPIFNADNEVKNIYKSNKNCFLKLKKKLPRYIKSFPIKKKNLIEAINADKNNLKKITDVVHPLVRIKLDNFLKKNKKRQMVILDIPLLVENNIYKKDDILIFVKTYKYKILNRLKKRANYNKSILKKLRNNQTLLFKKRKLANYIVENNYSPNIMKKKITFLKIKILNERSST
tara:strand:- start:553 stop:1140 length:588 start_codon:yes stop_codon:yes gene_type:complete